MKKQAIRVAKENHPRDGEIYSLFEIDMNVRKKKGFADFWSTVALAKQRGWTPYILAKGELVLVNGMTPFKEEEVE